MLLSLTNAVAFHTRVTKPENALYGVENFRVALFSNSL